MDAYTRAAWLFVVAVALLAVLVVAGGLPNF